MDTKLPPPPDPHLEWVNGALVYVGEIAGEDIEAMLERHREDRVQELITRLDLREGP